MLTDRPLARIAGMMAGAGVHLMTKGGAASPRPPVLGLTEIGEVIVCDCGTIASPDYRIRDYRKVRRPIWPLDDIAGTPEFILS